MNSPIQRQPESVTHMKGRMMMHKITVLGAMVLSLLMCPYGFADEGGETGVRSDAHEG